MAQRIAVTPRGGRLAPNYAKNYDADVPASLDYPAVSLHALLDQSAEVYPDSTATIFFNAKKSYRALFTDAKRFAAGLRSLGVKQGDRGAIAFQKVLSLGGDDSAAAVSPNDIAVLQYTGGTTGTSKGAMLSHRALVANTLQCAAWFGKAMRNGRDAVMGVMPLFHVYGLTTVMNFAVLSGGAIILEPQLDLEHVMKDIQRHKPTLFHGAPRIYNALNNSPLAKKYDLRSI